MSHTADAQQLLADLSAVTGNSMRADHSSASKLCLAAKSGDRLRWSVKVLLALIQVPAFMHSLGANEREATLVDGRAVAASLQEVGPNGQWLFRIPGRDEPLPGERVVRWGEFCERSGRTWILLCDRSVVVADLMRMDRDSVVIAGQTWPETQLPRKMVQAILFRPPLDLQARDRILFRARATDRREDCLLLEHGDELRGVAPDEVSPSPGGFHPELIRWPVRGTREPVQLSLERVIALLFASEPAAVAAEPACWVGLEDGSRLLVRHAQRQGRRLTLDLICGARLVTDESAVSGTSPLGWISGLQLLNPEVAYLSANEPIGYRHIPFLSTNWPYQVDKSVSGGQMRCGHQVYLRGVGMHSSSRLAYDVPEQYHSLQAELAIDRHVGLGGSVVFRVYLQAPDGQWSKAYESDVVRGGRSPIPMRVDLGDAARFALIVDFADRSDQGDHANWLNARLVR